MNLKPYAVKKEERFYAFVLKVFFSMQTQSLLNFFKRVSAYILELSKINLN